MDGDLSCTSKFISWRIRRIQLLLAQLYSAIVSWWIRKKLTGAIKRLQSNFSFIRQINSFVRSYLMCRKSDQVYMLLWLLPDGTLKAILSVALFVELRIDSGLFCMFRIPLRGTCCSSSFWYNFTQRYNTFQLQRNRLRICLPVDYWGVRISEMAVRYQSAILLNKLMPFSQLLTDPVRFQCFMSNIMICQVG